MKLTTGLLAIVLLLSAHAAQITAERDPALFDESLNIRITGLAPNSRVTLLARLDDDEENTWASYAVFDASADGVVDVATQAPLEGTYEGVDGMGLFWSMHPESEPEPEIFWRSNLEPLFVTLTAKVAGELVASAQNERLAVAPDVTRSEIPEPELYGTLFTPEREGPHPGVVVLGTAWRFRTQRRPSCR